MPAESADASAAPRRSPIMVVDDDAALLAALKFAFEAEGLVVATYLDAETALAAPAAPRSCLILDYRLPGLSGLDLLERFRARGDTTPAILITTHPSAATRERARVAGVDIIEKPLLGETLKRKVLELAVAGAT